MTPPPTPGQTYVCRGFRFRVDAVASGQVYVARWPFNQLEDHCVRHIRVTIDVWEKEMAEAQEVKS